MDVTRRTQLLRRIGVATGGLLVLVVAAVFVSRMFSGHPPPERPVLKVVQLRIVPPPPPPPPPQQKLPEPKMVEQPKMREPMVKPDKIVEQPKNTLPQPPGPPALDIKGEGAPDAFGLVGKPGGGDFGAGGGGSEGTRFGWYAAMIQSQIQSTLQKDDRLKGARYKVAVRLWLDAGGVPSRVELINSTGEAELDGELKQALLQMPKLKEAPPQDMPEPVILRIGAQRGS